MVPEQQVLAEWLAQPPDYHYQRLQYVQLKKLGCKKLNVLKLT